LLSFFKKLYLIFFQYPPSSPAGPVIDDSPAFVFPPTIYPVVRERVLADWFLGIGTICGKREIAAELIAFQAKKSSLNSLSNSSRMSKGWLS
jgi:hypothetical protein